MNKNQTQALQEYATERIREKKSNSWAGTVAHICNLALWEAKAGGSPEFRSSKPAWPTWWKAVSTKIYPKN